MFLTFSQTVQRADEKTAFPPPSAIWANGNDTVTLEWYLWPEIGQGQHDHLSSLRPSIEAAGPRFPEWFYPQVAYTYEDLASLFTECSDIWNIVFAEPKTGRNSRLLGRIERAYGAMHLLSQKAIDSIIKAAPIGSYDGSYPLATEPVTAQDVIDYCFYKVEGGDPPPWIMHDEMYVYVDVTILFRRWGRLKRDNIGYLPNELSGKPYVFIDYKRKGVPPNDLCIRIKKDAPRGPSVRQTQGQP